MLPVPAIIDNTEFWFICTPYQLMGKLNLCIKKYIKCKRERGKQIGVGSKHFDFKDMRQLKNLIFQIEDLL